MKCVLIGLHGCFENCHKIWLQKKTHHCKSIITAIDPSSRAAGWGLAKKNSYLENFNQGCIIVQLIAQQVVHNLLIFICLQFRQDIGTTWNRTDFPLGETIWAEYNTYGLPLTDHFVTQTSIKSIARSTRHFPSIDLLEESQHLFWLIR